MSGVLCREGDRREQERVEVVGKWPAVNKHEMTTHISKPKVGVKASLD